MLRRLVLIDRARSRQESLEALLQADFDLLFFQSFERALEEIRDLRPHGIIIIDDDQPEDILRSLRSIEASKELPLIVVGGPASPLKEVSAFNAGADDFISKESDPTVLKARLLGILRQSYVVKRLKSKLEEMDSFVRTVTHDLKNPIGAILSCAELLSLALDTGDLEEARELTASIQHSTENALEFMHDLLSLLRNGSPLRSVAEVESREVIEMALDELQMKIRASGALVDLPPELPRITCDKRRMVQVFVNIFSNAIKYVAKGTVPHITVATIETPHANTFVIGDNGIGMDPKDTKRIFQTFVRLPEATVYEGTGLGLSIVQRIIEAHEGDVFARSRKGLGSEFYVVLPTKLSFIGEREPQPQLESQPQLS
jgi:two-component system sensor histidine kinase/response regulator